MKCPVCGETLKPSKKDPEYLLCYTCKKKYKMPKKARVSEDVDEKVDEEPVKKAPKKKTSEKSSKKTEKQKYSNIPPKDVREKREREMKKAYDEMLAVEDEKVSKAPIIILAIAIIVVAAAIAYMLFFR